MSDTNSLARPLRIGFVLLDKFTIAAFGGLADVIRLAADDGGRSRPIHAQWTVMSVGGKPVLASCGTSIANNETLLEPSRFDYIAVCGGNDYLNADLPGVLIDYLRKARQQRVCLLGICTGSFALARAGVADGRTICVHWNVADAFTGQHPGVKVSVDRIFVDEGDIITCAGSTAAIDLGLYIVMRHCGRDRAQQVVRHMMLTGIRSPSLPQAHFRQELDPNVDPRVRKAVYFLEQQMDRPPSVGAVARYVGVGVRQLERAFQSSMGTTLNRVHRRMRLEYGRWMMDHKTESITAIAADCGFSDAAHFSREFKSAFGQTPRQYRRGVAA